MKDQDGHWERRETEAFDVFQIVNLLIISDKMSVNVTKKVRNKHFIGILTIHRGNGIYKGFQCSKVQGS